MSMCFGRKLSYNNDLMKIKVSTILQEVGLSCEIEYDELLRGEPPDEDFVLKAPIHVQAILVNSGMGIIVKGSIGTTLELHCSTCLSSFDYLLTLSFEERFIPSATFRSEGDEYEITGDEDFCYAYEEDEIDLANMIRELLILNLPIAPKCDINCRVKNLEKIQTIDPRFKLLEQLKDGG